MKILICHDSAQAVQTAALGVSKQVRAQPRSVLGLATGGTMEALYAALVRMHQQDGLRFAEVRSFNLDEYIGLPPSHPQSYHHYMQALFFQHIDIAPESTHLPLGDATDLAAEAERYEQCIAHSGGIDLQLLGVGENGHIGFNEPTSSLASRTRIKRLTRSTIAANQRFFGPNETPPQTALTMGIGTILEARKIVVLATGSHKARAVAQLVEGPISARWPGSVLQMHPQVSVVLDSAAAQALELRDYYCDIHPPEVHHAFV
jgi:glucosamine-6-phosphate deaminase